MNKIVVQKDFAYLYLNKDFYQEDIIWGVLPVYQDFFETKIQVFGNYYVLKIKSKEEDYSNELLANEFANYLISEMHR